MKNEWAKELVDTKAWVMHLPSGTIGPVKKLYDADGEPYVSPLNNQPVCACVLELESGHAFVAHADNFIRLSEKEVNFYLTATKVVGNLTKETAILAAAQGIPMKMALTMYAAALRAQTAALEIEPPENAA